MECFVDYLTKPWASRLKSIGMEEIICEPFKLQSDNIGISISCELIIDRLHTAAYHVEQWVAILSLIGKENQCCILCIYTVPLRGYVTIRCSILVTI